MRGFEIGSASRITLVALFLVTLIHTEYVAGAEPSGISEVGRILTDQDIWGSDGLVALAAVDRWSKVGERIIAIFPNEVVSGSKFENQEDARRAAEKLKGEMKKSLLELRPAYAKMNVFTKAITTRWSKFTATHISFYEDDTLRTVWRSEGGEFLKKNLKIQTVIERYGKPQKTTTEVVHGRGDRRPAVLTMYHYADGAVRFVESDLAAAPGFVDRVYLDTVVAARALFTTQP